MQANHENPDRNALAADAPSPHPLARFLREDDGNILLEYVTLLINVFLWVSLTVKPLQDALMWFAGQVFAHLHFT